MYDVSLILIIAEPTCGIYMLFTNLTCVVFLLLLLPFFLLFYLCC